MRYKTLGGTGFEVSRVVFGGIVNMDETAEDAVRYTAEAVDAGINYFDVAPSYGNAEARLSPALKPYRNSVYLACKTGQRTADNSRRELEASLKTLGTDHFDVYQLHAMTTPEDVKTVFEGGAIETMLWAKREGYIRNIGFSTHNEDTALKCLELYDFDTVLFPFSFSMGENDGWGERISAAAKVKGAGLLAMKTLIHRAWKDGDDRSRRVKSWCMPIDTTANEALAAASMKRAVSLGAATLIPPGNIDDLRFMISHIDRVCDEPLSDSERELLKTEAAAVRENRIFSL